MIYTYFHSNDFSNAREKFIEGLCTLSFMNDLKNFYGLIVIRAIDQLFPIFFLGIW